MSSRKRLAIAVALVISATGCTGHRAAAPPPPDQVTVYFCKAGTDSLVAFHYSAAKNASPEARAQSAVAQLLAGPVDPNPALLTFPADTRAKITVSDTIADVDLSGSITRRYSGGAGDEAGLFKSLTYTVTDIPGITAIQIRLNGLVAPALPGGQLELDEPLSRATFAQ